MGLHLELKTENHNQHNNPIAMLNQRASPSQPRKRRFSPLLKPVANPIKPAPIPIIAPTSNLVKGHN